MRGVSGSDSARGAGRDGASADRGDSPALLRTPFLARDKRKSPVGAGTPRKPQTWVPRPCARHRARMAAIRVLGTTLDNRMVCGIKYFKSVLGIAMKLFDLIFLASVAFVATLCVRIAVSALRRRRETTSRLGRLLGGFVGLYAMTLVCVALALPRRFYAPGERRCFDDWCEAAIEAKLADGPAGVGCRVDGGSRNWLATIEVSSDAKRIRQRAPDARAELEDRQGRRYQPCAAALPGGTGPAQSLSDELAPGESFYVFLPFRLPRDRTPAGLVVHHGEFPEAVIIGADQSLLHVPALQRLAVEQPR